MRASLFCPKINKGGSELHTLQCNAEQPTHGDRQVRKPKLATFKKWYTIMKKIKLDREKLKSKKLSLLKDKISDLNTETMLSLLGGSAYISQVVHCGSTAGSGNPQGCVGATTALGSCFSACGC